MYLESDERLDSPIPHGVDQPAHESGRGLPRFLSERST